MVCAVYSLDNQTMPSPPTPTLALLVPWAVGLSESCVHALPQFDQKGQLPHLKRLLSSLSHQAWLSGDEYQQATPHERFLAQAWQWPKNQSLEAGSACMPWAAWQALEDGLPVVEGQAWGLLSPCHWLVGREHLTVLAPEALSLTADESRAFFDAVRPLFESEGWQLLWGAPTRWYARHDSLAEMPTASLDRVVGRNPDVWMPNHPRVRLIRRLQSEVQMMLYQHPLNEAREHRGVLTVNSFWLSGTGATPYAMRDRPIQVLDGPRQALLRDDPAGWLQAWSELDDVELRAACQALDQGQAVELTLCGERHAVTLTRPQATGGTLSHLWHELRHRWRPPSVSPSVLLAQL